MAYRLLYRYLGPIAFGVLGLLLASIAPAGAPAGAAAAETPAWAAVRVGGAVLLMRHATAPGGGDPPGFRLDDCATQRTLSDAGRGEAEAIGAALRGAGVQTDRVFSSEWCRCLETAERLGLAPVQRLALLNSVFTRPEAAAPQTAALKAWIAARPAGSGTTVLVTHQVNITAATGIVPRSGEIVVALPQPGGELRVIGTIPPP